MKIRYDSDIKETIYEKRMSNGLQVFLLPKAKFQKFYGIIGVNFGSLDTCYKKDGKLYKVKDGSAHFLEHKMFESSLGDYDDLFSKYGATTNAFTSLTQTNYLFECDSHLNECIKLLLDMVSKLEISKESIEKEKGIIIEEIHSYDDDYSWVSYFKNISNLYYEHPITIDVAGSEESVKNMLPSDLQQCFDAFYHPANMVLFVTGPLNGNETMEMIEQYTTTLKYSPYTIEKVIDYHEKDTVYKKEEIIYRDIALEKINLSIKIKQDDNDPKKILKKEIGMNILLDIYFAKSSLNYLDWLNRGIINDSFGYSYSQGRDYSYLQLELESENIEQFEKEVIFFLNDLEAFKVTDEDFEVQKRKNIGYLISMFNYPDGIANTFVRYYFDRIDAFDLLKEAKTITKEEVLSYRHLLDTENISICKVKKKSFTKK